MKEATGRKAFRMSFMMLLLVLLAGAMIISLVFGSADITLSKIWHTLWASQLQDTQDMVIWNIRLPRNIVASLVGASLAVSGAILQAVMKNPLADPQIVGVSSGAGLAGVIILILFPGYDYLVPGFAFFGAMAAALMVYALAWKNGVIEPGVVAEKLNWALEPHGFFFPPRSGQHRLLHHRGHDILHQHRQASV